MNLISKYLLVYLVILILVLIVILIVKETPKPIICKDPEKIVKELISQNIFEIKSFDSNETGFGYNIVPNIVHYVLFTIHEIQFAHFISILSVLKNQRPDQIYIHCDCNQLSGDYYRRVLRVANKTKTPIIIRTIERPTQIFGKKLSTKWHNWHLSDITRSIVLQEFGGIYLDRDVYVVKSSDVFHEYEMTLI